MIRSILLAAAALPALIAPLALPLATPLAAQSVSQAEIEARYDRALAAGYKALMLCSAIANAERNGATRTPESVMEWELAGIQPPLDGIVGELRHTIFRDAARHVALVEVEWAEAMPPRFAKAGRDSGCRLAPIGARPSMQVAIIPDGSNDTTADGNKLIELGGWGAERASHWQYQKLEKEALGAFGNAYGAEARTTAILVKRGEAVSEQYREDFDHRTPQRTWSVAKSIAATIIGAAVYRDEVELHRSDQVLNRSIEDGRRFIKLDHLLRMASGRYSDTPGNRTDPLYFGGSTVEETAAHWPLLHEPGTVFRYANNDTLMAVKAIEDTFDDHPPAAFFAKVGMDHTVAETDWQGDYILSSQVWSTARDLARLGQLYLDDGVLPSGERVLPEGWVEYVSSPSGPQPEDRSWGYGAGFWLFNNHDGIPADTFFAAGNRGQYVVIVPSRDVVIVRRGEDPAGARFDIEAFTRDVLAALEE